MRNVEVMIDCETLATEPNAPVLTLGACAFDITSGEIVAEFYERMDKTKAQIYGLSNLNTIKWWESQDPAAREEAYHGTVDPRTAARSFRDWFVKYNLSDCGVWANGSVFDIPIIENWLRQTNPVIGKYGHDYPWRFWNVRDVRTILWLAGMKMPRTRPAHVQFHNALHDARYQVEWVCKAYAKLKGVSNWPPTDMQIYTD